MLYKHKKIVSEKKKVRRRNIYLFESFREKKIATQWSVKLFAEPKLLRSERGGDTYTVKKIFILNTIVIKVLKLEGLLSIVFIEN